MNKDLKSVHFIRAIASIAVCIFHLYCGNKLLFNDDNLLKKIFSFGYLGVEMFFILSGFIICYALPRNFSSNDFITFLKKRLMRIEPPYIISIILVLTLNFLSHQITGLANFVDWLNVLLHLAYLNNFNLGEYLSPIYWTLGIEFQFYILIAFIFPSIKNINHIYFFSIILITISLLEVPPGFSIIAPYMSIFGLGILTYFFKHTSLVDLTNYLIIITALLLQIFFSLGLSFLVACILTIFILHFYKFDYKIVSYLSSISFSLYLTHVTIGGRVINLGLRYTQTEMSRFFLFLIALLTSLLFAHLFYILVEKPAIKYSKNIKYFNPIS